MRGVTRRAAPFTESDTACEIVMSVVHHPGVIHTDRGARSVQAIRWCLDRVGTHHLTRHIVDGGQGRRQHINPFDGVLCCHSFDQLGINRHHPCVQRLNEIASHGAIGSRKVFSHDRRDIRIEPNRNDDLVVLIVRPLPVLAPLNSRMLFRSRVQRSGPADAQGFRLRWRHWPAQARQPRIVGYEVQQRDTRLFQCPSCGTVRNVEQLDEAVDGLALLKLAGELGELAGILSRLDDP